MKTRGTSTHRPDPTRSVVHNKSQSRFPFLSITFTYDATKRLIKGCCCAATRILLLPLILRTRTGLSRAARSRTSSSAAAAAAAAAAVAAAVVVARSGTSSTAAAPAADTATARAHSPGAHSADGVPGAPNHTTACTAPAPVRLWAVGGPTACGPGPSTHSLVRSNSGSADVLRSIRDGGVIYSNTVHG